MLVSPEAKAQIDSEVIKLIKRLQASLENEETGLVQTYLAGKTLSYMHPARAAVATLREIVKFAKHNGIALNEADKAILEGMREESLLWLAGLQDELTKRVRSELLQAEQKWVGEMLVRDAEGELRKSLWTDLKEHALEALVGGVVSVMSMFESMVDRLLQTELAKYFQHGQVAEVAMDEEVYKIPRMQACPHCMRLHVDSEGKPIVYKLKDVQGNSNVGKKSAEWSFVVGPVHPHCYCILYRVEARPPMPSPLMAEARKESLAVGLQKRREILEAARRRYQEALLQSE